MMYVNHLFVAISLAIVLLDEAAALPNRDWAFKNKRSVDEWNQEEGEAPRDEQSIWKKEPSYPEPTYEKEPSYPEPKYEEPAYPETKYKEPGYPDTMYEEPAYPKTNTKC